MNLIQVEYILKIAEENNITRAAEKLFITQPALNQQLLKLEKELGTPLFHRSRTDWRLTEAGEIYVRGARELMRIKENTYSQIRDVTDRQKGSLSIGLTPVRGTQMFNCVYPKFHQHFPEIVVTPAEMRVREMQAMIYDGRLDIGFLTLCESDFTKDTYIPIQEEELFVAIPANHPLAGLAAPAGEAYAQISLDQLKEEKFVLMDKTSTMRSMVEKIFAEADFTPNILFQTKDNTTILSMVQSGICCSIVPEYYIKEAGDTVATFALPSHPKWVVAASHKHDRYLSKAGSYFIELAREYWTQNPEA